jgi:uncharacterized protein
MEVQHILIAGGSGMVGRHLTQVLTQKGYQVKWLSRKASPESYVWAPERHEIDQGAVTWAHAIINLAGAGIADKHWSKSRKKELIESRTRSAETILQAIKASGKTQIPYLAASAVGYYGNSGETLMYENSTPTDQAFLSQCCQAWESATQLVTQAGNPTTVIRIGIVLDKQHGALAKIIEPMRFGMGAWFGNGKMWMPWVHHHDLCNLFIWVLQNGKTGVYNAVAPHPARNKDFTIAAKKAFHPWALLLPAPALALRLALGEMSAVVLNSNRVSAEKALAEGFQFGFPNLQDALAEIARDTNA